MPFYAHLIQTSSRRICAAMTTRVLLQPQRD
jgi:hypothetical protein